MIGSMSYIREDSSRVRRQLTQEAIDLAMRGQWEEAVVVNREIIESFPTDADAYNRLGRALTELGRYREAREAYNRALELDPWNTIARKNLNRLALLRDEAVVPQPARHQIAPQLFVGEVGKSGVVSLEGLAPRETLARLVAGDELFLRVRGERLLVEDHPGNYIGEVEPRHSLRLIRLIAGGNQYAAAIASLGDKEVKVAIRETFQHPSQAGKLSFPVVETPSRAPERVEEETLEIEEEEEETLSTVASDAEGEEKIASDGDKLPRD